MDDEERIWRSPVVGIVVIARHDNITRYPSQRYLTTEFLTLDWEGVPVEYPDLDDGDQVVAVLSPPASLVQVLGCVIHDTSTAEGVIRAQSKTFALGIEYSGPPLDPDDAWELAAPKTWADALRDQMKFWRASVAEARAKRQASSR